LTYEPADDCRCGCREEETKGSPEGTDGKVGERPLDIPLANKLDGFQGIDEARKYDEAGNPSLALPDKSKDRLLHPLLGAHLTVRRSNNITSESHGKMTEHDIDGCDTSKALHARLAQWVDD
jgi:hypothetical protein